MAGGYAYQPLGVYAEAARWRAVWRAVGARRQAGTGIGISIDPVTGTVTNAPGSSIALRGFDGNLIPGGTVGTRDFSGNPAASAVVIQTF